MQSVERQTVPRDVCRQRHEKWHVQVSVISRETFAKHQRVKRISGISCPRFHSKLRFEKIRKFPFLKENRPKETKIRDDRRISISNKKKKKSNKIIVIFNSFIIYLRKIENFSRSTGRDSIKDEFTDAKRERRYNITYIVPRKQEDSYMHRG